jgi:hypothetical protein
MAAEPGLPLAVATVCLVALLGLPAAFVGAQTPTSPGGAPTPRTISACAKCPPPAGGTTRSNAAAIDWRNVTPEQFGALPPASAQASMAYDVADQEAVWFGGCPATGCASNQTWVYRNSTWSDLSRNLTVAPPPRSAAMMDYDPNAHAVVLVGGHVEGPGAGNQFSNDTWEFSGGAWTRLSSPCATNAPACLNPQSSASFAFDANRSVNSSVLFGGCFAFLACTTLDNETWWFNGTSGRWLLESAFPPVGAPSARAAAAMSYDPTLQALVLFGGYGRCGTANCTRSDTWTYGAGTWTNVTATFGAGPPGRVGGSLTWDAGLGEMLLSGGTGATGGAPSNSTFALRCAGPGARCNWSGPLAVTGTGLSGAAAAANSSQLDPMFVGGTNANGTATNATWVYSALPHLDVAVAPSPPEVGRPENLTVYAVDSVGPTFRVLWGDGASVGSSSGNLVHTFSAPAVYNATVAVVDRNGSANIHDLELIVHSGPAVTIIVLYPGVDVGIPDTFTAAPVLGNGTTPFNITWNFGTGPPLYGASVVHAFPTVGNQTVVASIVDALGLRTRAVTNVSVAAAPNVTILPQYVVGGRPVADSGVSTSLLARVNGGTAPFNFTWEFGDGSEGYGPGPSHSFGTAPATRPVSVAVTDAGGGQALGSAKVSVAPFPTIASIATSPVIPTAGGTVEFAATLAGGVGTGTVDWTFGDGSVGSGANATHPYRSAGTYVATAWWNDSAGGSAVRSVNVTVAPFVTPLLGFLLNPIVLSGILILAAAGVALYARSRRRRSLAAEAPPAPELPTTPPPAGP